MTAPDPRAEVFESVQAANIARAQRANSEPDAVARVKAEALREAARVFADEMSVAWGGSAPWFTTGAHVATLAADLLNEEADRIERGEP